MKISQIMTTPVRTVSPSSTLKEAAAVMAELDVSGLPVVDVHGNLVGVVSEADILFKVRGRLPEHGFLHSILHPAEVLDEELRLDAHHVADAMSTPARTIAATASLARAASEMLDKGVKRLPVVDSEGRLVGIVTRTDLVRAFTRCDEEIAREIREDVIRRTLWLSPDTIEIDVRSGIVTLRGRVDSEADRELLPTFVRRVAGVVDVRSELVLASELVGVE